jgi:hypothetical protein
MFECRGCTPLLHACDNKKDTKIEGSADTRVPAFIALRRTENDEQPLSSHQERCFGLRDPTVRTYARTMQQSPLGAALRHLSVGFRH